MQGVGREGVGRENPIGVGARHAPLTARVGQVSKARPIDRPSWTGIQGTTLEGPVRDPAGRNHRDWRQPSVPLRNRHDPSSDTQATFGTAPGALTWRSTGSSPRPAAPAATNRATAATSSAAIGSCRR